MRRSALMFVLAGLVGAVVAVPIAVYASHSFTDVPNSNTFHSDIEWLADAGVTKGCNPPANTEFCPKDVVTREAMAAFLHRLADNQVVDAGQLEGVSAAGYVMSTQLLHASVDAAGNLKQGNAVSATRLGTGRYEVTFDRSLNNCSATATTGGVEPSSFNYTVTQGIRLINKVAQVFVWKTQTSQDFDNPFQLVVVCPQEEANLLSAGSSEPITSGDGEVIAP